MKRRNHTAANTAATSNATATSPTPNPNVIRIGYQGMEGSFSRVAAGVLYENHLRATYPDKTVEFVPCLTSAMVMTKLQAGEVDYGVMATKNSLGGIVAETEEVLDRSTMELVGAFCLKINQCLFKKNETVALKDITEVASHIQALRQTVENRKRLIPNAKEVVTKDTAYAATKLAQGKYPPTTAVVCSREAGELNGLCLVEADIEDRKGENQTEFRLIKLPDQDYLEQEEMYMPAESEAIGEKIVEILIALVIIVSVIVIAKYDMSVRDAAFSVGSEVVFFYAIYKIIDRLRRHKSITGHYKYYPNASNGEDASQMHSVPRLVEITETGGNYSLKIYTPHKNGSPIISVISSRVIVATEGRTKGTLFYTYTSAPDEMSPLSKTKTVAGYAFLDWTRRHSFATVRVMKGMYFGTSSGEMGQLTFRRISDKEFENIRKSTFLEV